MVRKYHFFLNPKGDDVDNWSMESLENVVSKFIEKQKNKGETESDDGDDEDSHLSPEEE